MHTTTALITVLKSTTLALANPAPAPQPAVIPGARLVSPRQLTSTTRAVFPGGCTSAYKSLVDTQPTPPPEVVSWVAVPDIADVADMDQSFLSALCTPLTRMPSSGADAAASSAAESFADVRSRWISSKSADFASLRSFCDGDVSGLVELMTVTDYEGCSSAVRGLMDYADGDTVTTTTGGSPTETGGAGGHDVTTTESTGGVAAARETGFVAAAAAMAVGVAGVVAAL